MQGISRFTVVVPFEGFKIQVSGEASHDGIEDIHEIVLQDTKGKRIAIPESLDEALWERVEQDEHMMDIVLDAVKERWQP